MALRALLVANRAEIAIRVLRAAAELGIRTVAVHSADDVGSPHVRHADGVRPLPGTGPAAYLDVDAVIAAAVESECDAIHPGYGFLAERADFAERCAAAGITFVGPRPELLATFGDKSRARRLAAEHDVPLLPGTSGPTTLAEAEAFFAAQPPGGAIVLKAIAGGGGRGMRVVRDRADLAEAFTRCCSEAEAAFGRGDLYAERHLGRARHVEVQIVGDGTGAVAALGERECSLQRRHQKLVEIAPSPSIGAALRARLLAAARRMAEAVDYESLGTFEFLVDADGGPNGDVYFLEVNPRIQVEHTVTEAVTGIDLVATQLRLAGGARLADVGLGADAVAAVPRGHAIQLRVNTETMGPDGDAKAGGGTLAVYEPPTGPGVRVDAAAHTGLTTNPRFDSLLAKIVVHAPGAYATAVAKATRALDDCRIEGVPTNLGFLRALLRHPAVVANDVDTGFVERHAKELVAAAADSGRPAPAGSQGRRLAGARVDPNDPLAVLAHGKSGGPRAGAGAGLDDAALADHDEASTVRAQMQGTIVSLDVAEGDTVRAGQTLLVMEAMKMEHVVAAETAGRVRRLAVAAGDTVFEGHVLALVDPSELAETAVAAEDAVALDHVRPDLAEAIERHAIGHDAARPESVARRRATGQRTARENVDDLCDPGSFVEYGALVLAAQRQRRSVEDLIAKTPADGLVCGIGTINGATAPKDRASAVVLAYDYTVLAGTQGAQNHRKKDRMLEIAERERLPVVLFSEGGGGRPGDTDALGIAGLDVPTFQAFARLSGLVPLVGVNSGYCFAGNAALLGCCDVVIATANSNIGMGGPAMVEGGGLGVFRPEEIGPMAVQSPNGVVDVAVTDEAEAVAVAKRYLGYFQGARADWTCDDQRRLRASIPENRLRVYDVRKIVTTLADTDSVLELRRPFGLGMVTALARIEGRPVGIVANNPTYLAGAIDADGADKAARFLQLCDAFDLPVVFLCDTPGIMVGPEIEKRALVRHAARLFVVGASLTVPVCTIVLRKGYGLGAMAMAGGSFKAGLFTMAWPTGEFGGMGLEGAVKLGFRKELAAIADPAERRKLYETMVERMYRYGKGVSAASHFEIDDVIDPKDTRDVIARALAAVPLPARRLTKKRPCIDTW